MRLFLLSIAALLVMTGCTAVKPTYDSAHQRILEDSVSALKIGEELKIRVKPGSRVVLRSMERATTQDTPLIAMVEDLVIRSLVNNGYRVLERDEESLNHLRQEHGKGYKKEEAKLLPLGTVTAKELKMKTLTAPSLMELSNTALGTADYVVSYRVLEAGVKNISLDDGFQWSDIIDQYLSYTWWVSNKLIERESLMRLHVRVQNAKTGEIVFAKNFMDIKAEKMEEKLVNQLSDYHYDFFANNTPLQKKQAMDVQNLVIGGAKEEVELDDSFVAKVQRFFKNSTVEEDSDYSKTIYYTLGYGLNGDASLGIGFEKIFGTNICLSIEAIPYTDSVGNTGTAGGFFFGYKMGKLTPFYVYPADAADEYSYGVDYDVISKRYFTVSGRLMRLSKMTDTLVVTYDPANITTETFIGVTAKLGF